MFYPFYYRSIVIVCMLLCCCLLYRIRLKIKMIVFLIGIAVVASLIYTFLYCYSEENVSSFGKRLLTDRNTVNNYDFAEFSDNLKTLWNTSADSRNVSGATNSYTVHIPYINVPGINCAELFNGNVHEVVEARVRQAKQPKRAISDDIYVQAAAECTEYINRRRFIMQPLSSEEADFPLAFSIVMFRDVELFERLLRAIYRPQNVYCIHVDKKSASTVHRAVAAIASCFNNVFIAPRIISVDWGTYAVLEAELICMEALLSYGRKWRYFINLTGQEFPLKTNWDIVKILKVFHGANNIEGTIKRLLS